MKKTLNKFCLFLIAGIFVSVDAQKTIATAKIDTVAVNGYYKIPLLPKHQAHAFQYFSNLRIYTKDSVEVPFLIPNLLTHQYSYSEYQALPKEQYQIQSVDNKSTRIVIDNSNLKLGGYGTSYFALRIKNSDANKKCILRGSDNNKKWYSISDKRTFNKSYSDDPSYTILKLDYDPVHYRFYELILNDSLEAPYKIVDIGMYHFHTQETPFEAIPGLDFITLENKERKSTQITCRLPFPTLINRLQFHIQSPTLFKRKVTLNVVQSNKNEKEIDLELVSKDDKNYIFELPEIYTDKWTFEIFNEDNPPLQIDSMNVFQYSRALYAYLDAGAGYFISFGDSGTLVPEYDISYFANQFPKNPKILNLHSIEVHTLKKESEKSVRLHFWQTKTFLWICISFALLVVVIMATNLLKDMKQ